MKYRRRIYYSADQRAEIWDRWQRGESMSSIGRSFERESSSVYSVISPTGGIRPFTGQYKSDLEILMDIGEQLGGLLGQKCAEALGILPEQAESYGKAALVGANGVLEHAAAILHPRMGKPLRAAVVKGVALVPSSKKMGAMGHPLDIPLGHKDAAYVRSHFDGMEVRINDAPRANEIMVAIAVTNSGRPLPRVGGLEVKDAKGEGGLR